MIDYKPQPEPIHKPMDTVIAITSIVILIVWIAASFVNHTTLWGVWNG